MLFVRKNKLRVWNGSLERLTRTLPSLRLYQAACAVLLTSAHGPSILQANPLLAVTTRWIPPHLESNLRPCITIHSILSTWLLSRPFRPPAIYDVYHTRQPLKDAQHTLRCRILRDFLFQSFPLECTLTLMAKNSGSRLSTSSPPPRARHSPLSPQSSPSRSPFTHPSLFHQVV